MPDSQGNPTGLRPPRSADVAARAEATRQLLIDSARTLFVEQGYFHTGTEEIVQRAGVTRGALYHHFADKKALFRAVFEAIETELMSAARPAGSAGAFDQLRDGLLGFLDASLTPQVQRVLLIDGPAVLGWHEWRTLEAQYGLGALRRMLTDAIADGTLTPQPVEVLANILLAALDEAALYIANAPDQPAARDASVTAMDGLLSGLRSTGARR
ncbi:MAG: TetR/AcrR family transcriptional regulator [Ilumatobacteraceae bacterium]